jgi:hypothetical protein
MKNGLQNVRRLRKDEARFYAEYLERKKQREQQRKQQNDLLDPTTKTYDGRMDADGRRA